MTIMNMNLYRVKAWTGPGFVSHYAAKLREANIKVTCEGTEHVYAEIEGESRYAVTNTAKMALYGNTEPAFMQVNAVEVWS
jgi:hypothetical protein